MKVFSLSIITKRGPYFYLYFVQKIEINSSFRSYRLTPHIRFIDISNLYKSLILLSNTYARIEYS